MATFRTLIAASTLVPALALTACSAGATGIRSGGPRLSDGDSFSMAPGTSVSVPGEGRLSYVKLVNDSRCLPDVQCVWAGDAEVAFQWQPDGRAVDAFSLHTGKGDTAHRIGAHRLVLVSLARGEAPAAQLKLEAAP